VLTVNAAERGSNQAALNETFTDKQGDLAQKCPFPLTRRKLRR
jgi:hypothetical protein